MNVQAINSAMSSVLCQPVNRVEFARREAPSKHKEMSVEKTDSFASSDPYTMEQKYNLACRLAAYYKTQYEALLENGCCIA